MTIKTLCIFGTRPEAIKMAPIIKRLSVNKKISNKVCVTGQHRDLLDPVLKFFNIFPDFDLDIMKDNQTLSDITSNILSKLKGIFNQYTPDIVLVHGDTITTFSASISAYFHKITVAHVEAGLRTGNIYSPWPEEANRKLTAALARIHFAPTLLAYNNLLKEGVAKDSIYLVGNTVVDSFHEALEKLKDDDLKSKIQLQFPFLNQTKKVLLITSHRRENFGKGLEQICLALLQIAQLFPQILIVYPVHPNSNVQQPVKEILTGYQNIYPIEPVDYLPFVYLMQQSYLILTDSGGVQEEAVSLGKPVLVMRAETERSEAIKAGGAILTGTNAESIVSAVKRLITNNEEYLKMTNINNPYGDGKAAERLVKVLESFDRTEDTSSNNNINTNYHHAE